VLVKMEMTDETWHLVKNTPKVTGFLGSRGKPSPITDAEAERIVKQVKEGVERPRPSITFEVGEQVRVCDGPFTSFNGMVEEVDEERARLKVAVSARPRSSWNTRRSRRSECHRAGGQPLAVDRTTRT
jgi:transcriptional antiterminator NusG